MLGFSKVFGLLLALDRFMSLEAFTTWETLMSLGDLGGMGTKGKFARTRLASPLDLLTIITGYS